MNRAKVYQLGLRNSFRISVNAVTGQLYTGEVGWTTWEEVNIGGPGANFGWPVSEGGSGVGLVFSAYAANPKYPELAHIFANLGPVVAPIYALNHVADGINVIVSGAKLSSSYYGAEYQGDLFLNDLGQGIVSHISSDASGNFAGINVFTFANVFVNLYEGPDGALYFCTLGDNRVGHWELR